MKNNSNLINNHEVKKLLFFIGFLLSTILIFWKLSELGWLNILADQQKMQIIIERVGLYGPLIIILLISLAIIISPFPSAPVALVSGALYGHTLGTIYIILGSIAGAISAFLIARKLGHEYIYRTLQPHIPLNNLSSQNSVMLIVFLTRLAPFISFDVISYAAGLTNLSFGRFFIATLMGIIPISFILAHLGSEILVGESESIAYSILILGLVMIIPLLIKMFIKNDN